MTKAHAAKAAGDKMSPEDINGQTDVLGKQIWRIVPYAKKYPKRVAAGIFANGAARFFDLMPFVAIGLAVDYFTTDVLSGPAVVQSMVSAVHSDPAVGYGVLIFLGFLFLAIFQGISEYSWQTLGYNIQHDLRMDATRSLIAMEASYYDLRQTGQIMSVLSSDVNQLEDVVSDSSTSIIRIFVTFATAFLILVLMSWKLAAVLFTPIIFIVPAVYWFSTRVQRKYRKQRESTGDIHAVLENLISGIAVVQAYNAEQWEANRVATESGSYRDQAMGASADRNRFIPMIYAVAGVAFGLLTTAGGYFASQGEITTGQLVTFLLISTRMTMPMFIFGILVNQLQRGEAAARRVFAARKRGSHDEHRLQRAGHRVSQLNVADALHVLARVDGVLPRALERAGDEEPEREHLLYAALGHRVRLANLDQRGQVNVVLVDLVVLPLDRRGGRQRVETKVREVLHVMRRASKSELAHGPRRLVVHTPRDLANPHTSRRGTEHKTVQAVHVVERREGDGALSLTSDGQREHSAALSPNLFSAKRREHSASKEAPWAAILKIAR